MIDGRRVPAGQWWRAVCEGGGITCPKVCARGGGDLRGAVMGGATGAKGLRVVVREAAVVRRAQGERAGKLRRRRRERGRGEGTGSAAREEEVRCFFFFFFFRFERFLIPTLVRSQSATADWLPLPVSRRAGEIPREERRADRGARALRVRLADKAELRVWGSAVLRGCEVMRAEIPFPS